MVIAEFPFTILPFISWSCTCDFHILTLDFTLVTSISWLWILHLHCPYLDIGFYLCDLHALILDLIMMNSLSAWWLMALCQLYHLCGHCTLQLSFMNRDSLKSLYASCGWHMFMGLLKIDSTRHSYFATWWYEFTFFLENDLACCIHHGLQIDSLLVMCTLHLAILSSSLWIVVILVLDFDPLPMSDWQLHVHGAWHNLLLMIVS